MKKTILLLACTLLLSGLCACQAEKSDTSEETTVTVTEAAEESAQEEIVAEEPEDAVVDAGEEQLPEDVQILGEQEFVKEAREEEAVLEQDPAVFEEITTELTTYPIIKYTIMGEQKQIDYTMYENLYPYNMVSNAEFAIGYSTGDVTGDGLDDLIISIYAVGNTLSEALQDTYVYSVDADINDLNEILYISAQGGEQFVPGYPNNIGAAPTGNGTLRLDVCTMKGEGGAAPTTSFAELVYQDGMWSVK